MAEHALQDACGGAVLVGEGSEGVPQLPHEHGRRHAVARDVADRHVHDAVGTPHRVVPIPADHEPGAAGGVAPDQLDAVDVGQVGGEQAVLQPHRDLVLALEGGRALERLRSLLGEPRDLLLLALVERAGMGEEQAERAEPRPAARHERRRVEGVGLAEQRMVNVRECRAQARVLADHDGGPRVVGERRGLGDDHLAHVRRRGKGAVGGGGELEEAVMLVLEGDDAERARERPGEPGDEAVGDLAAERGVADRAQQLPPLLRTPALACKVAAAAQQREADQEEDERRRSGDERELQQQGAPRSLEEARARLVDHDRPAGDARGAEGDGMVRRAVEAARVGERSVAVEGAREGGIGRHRGAVEDRAPRAVEDREIHSPEVERPPADREGLDPQSAREHAGQPAGGVSRRSGHDDDSAVRQAGSEALAHVGRARRDHVAEVGAVGDVDELGRRTMSRADAYDAVAVDPRDPAAERRPAVALEAIQVALHDRQVAGHDGGRARDRAQRRELAAEVRLDDAAREHRPCPLVAERGPLRVGVLRACEAPRDEDESEHREQRAEREVPAVREAVSPERSPRSRMRRPALSIARSSRSRVAPAAGRSRARGRSGVETWSQGVS